MKQRLMFCLLLFLFISCDSKNTITSIKIDLSKSKEIDFLSKEMIRLRGNDEDLIFDMLKKVLFTDSLYVVQTGRDLLCFNSATGLLINRFSGKGRAKNEYIHLWDSWIEDDELFIYDIDGKKILKFNLMGDFKESIVVKSESDPKPFQFLAKVGHNQYIGKRMYGVGQIAELAIYDNDFKFMKDLSDFSLRSGMHLGYPFYNTSDNTVLYNRSLDNEIYEVSDNDMSVKYQIDFLSNNVPENERNKDEYQIINFVNNADQKYATHITNLYESDTFFCFTFLFDAKKYIAVYNKEKERVRTYFFDQEGINSLDYISFYNEQVILFFENVDGVPFVIKLNDMSNL